MLPVYWYLVTGSALNPYRLRWPYDRPGFGPDVGVKGHTLADGLFNTRFNLGALGRAWLGWPGYANVVLLFLPFIARPRERWNYLLLASFASLVDLHVAYWFYGGHDAGFPRYYYAALPMLLLLTARGIEFLGVALSHLANSLRNRPWIAKLPLYVALAGLVLYNGLVFLPPNLAMFRDRNGVNTAPLQVVRRAGVKNALVFTSPYEHWHDFAVFFAANSPTLDSDIVYAVYRNPVQAQAVKALYPERQCYLYSPTRLQPCPF
jgi:hypothetical protein